MKSKKLVGIIIIFVVLAMIVWNISNGKTVSDLKYQLDSRYSVNEVQTWRDQKIELYQSMYHEKSKTGFCVFRAEIGNSSIEEFCELVSVKGTGCMDVTSEVIENTEYIYLSFSMEQFEEGYEHLVLFQLEDEEIARFTLKNTVDEKNFKSDGECEVTVTPVSIIISKQGIQDINLVYEGEISVNIMQNGKCMNGTLQFVQSTGSTLILLEKFCDIEGLQRVIVDGDKARE